MIEVTATYDFIPGIDQKEYEGFVKRALSSLVKAPGFVELRAYRNLASSPFVRSTYVFQTLADWARYTESTEFQTLMTEGRRFVTDIRVDAWGPSPVVTAPVRPAK